MPDAPSSDTPEQPSVCLVGTAVLDRLKDSLGPDALHDRSLGRTQLDRLEASERLGDVVQALAGELAEPYTGYLNAQPARLQSDLLTLVRAAVAEGNGVEIDLELRRTGRPGAQVTTWYDDQGAHRAVVVFLPPPP
jgi:hypothetical protein